MTATPLPVTSYGYPMASYGTATGRWTVSPPDSVVTDEWGTFRIELGAYWDPSSGTAVLGSPGTDITTVNGVPTIIDMLTFALPYGEMSGQLTLPGLTPFDGGIDWPYSPGTFIDIYRVLPAAAAGTYGTAEVPYWHGYIASVEMADGAGLSSSVSLQLMGALFGEASMRAHQPVMLDDDRDIGTSLGQALDVLAYSRPLTPYLGFAFTSTTTGIETRHRGSRGEMVLDFCDEMLGLAQDPTGQYSIFRDYTGSPTRPRARCYNLALKSDDLAGALQQNYIFAGGYGVALSITQDITEGGVNAIYGEGLSPTDSAGNGGDRWRNARYPLLTPSAPAYPDRISGSDYPLTTGDVDADFTVDVVTQLQAQLRMAGQPDVQITGTFDTDTAIAISAAKDDAGWVNTTGTVANDAEWDLLFSADAATGTTDLSSGYFRPLAEVSTSQKYTFRTDGAVTGDNPLYEYRLRVERTISFADQISKSRARTYARRVVNQSTVNGTGSLWAGTITLTSDPTDELGNARSRLDIREGSWIRVNNLNDGTYRDFHISSVSVAAEMDSVPVTLTVSEVAWDLLDLSTRMDRNREAHTDPAKSFYSLRNRPNRAFRDVTGWDAESGAGVIAPVDLTANQWNVVRMIGAQRGSIGAISLTTTSSPTSFAFAMFGGSVAGTALDTLIPLPLGTVAGGYDSHWAVPSKQDTLESMRFIEAWGSYGEAAGYWPGSQSVGTALSAGTVTGRMVDALAWDFVSADPPFLWAAFWPTADCTIHGTARVLIEE